MTTALADSEMSWASGWTPRKGPSPLDSCLSSPGGERNVLEMLIWGPEIHLTETG